MFVKIHQNRVFLQHAIGDYENKEKVLKGQGRLKMCIYELLALDYVYKALRPLCYN